MISIIITCCNREEYLAQAITSVLAQTYKNFELIVWDDGSTDNSIQIAQTYANKDNRIKVVAAKHEGFVSASLNAIALSKGQYFGCVDSDDYLDPDCLEETEKILSNSLNTGVVYTQYGQVDALNNFQGIGHRCFIPFSKERMLLNHITFHFRLIRRNVYDVIGGLNPYYKYASDYDLCLRLSEVTEFYHLPKLLYFHRNHSDSMSSNSKGLQVKYAMQAIKEARKRQNKL